MIDYKIILATIGILLSFASYIPYLLHIYQGKTKPHAFSWLVWSTLTGIIFAAQITENAGPGMWITGISSILCFVIFISALRKGHKEIHYFDWLSLAVAFISIGLWIFTKSPLISVILITLADVNGFIPTFRKSYSNPNQETISLYLCAAINWAISIIALETYNISTTLYPASLVLTNTLFVSMTFIRRKKIKK